MGAVTGSILIQRRRQAIAVAATCCWRPASWPLPAAMSLLNSASASTWRFFLATSTGVLPLPSREPTSFEPPADRSILSSWEEPLRAATWSTLWPYLFGARTSSPAPEEPAACLWGAKLRTCWVEPSNLTQM